eukprot:3353059-Pyramimonas_sp.AAC.1
MAAPLAALAEDAVIAKVGERALSPAGVACILGAPFLLEYPARPLLLEYKKTSEPEPEKKNENDSNADSNTDTDSQHTAPSVIHSIPPPTAW